MSNLRRCQTPAGGGGPVALSVPALWIGTHVNLPHSDG